MISLMFYSGLRCCEIVRANLEDVDLDSPHHPPAR